MRIARLDLTRYGRFSDYQLDFGAAPLGGSDFHIVYGLNETGKSTAAAGDPRSSVRHREAIGLRRREGARQRPQLAPL